MSLHALKSLHASFLICAEIRRLCGAQSTSALVDMLVEVVNPSFEGHLLFLHDQLASWYRYCIDASRVNFTIVTSDFAETVLFRKALKRLETMLSIRVLVSISATLVFYGSLANLRIRKNVLHGQVLCL